VARSSQHSSFAKKLSNIGKVSVAASPFSKK